MAAACAVAAPALRSACQDALPPPPAYREVQPALGAVRQQLLRGVGVLRERRAQQQVARAAGKHRHAAAVVRCGKLRAGGGCKKGAGRGGALGGAGGGGGCGRAATGRRRRVGLPWPGRACRHGVAGLITMGLTDFRLKSACDTGTQHAGPRPPVACSERTCSGRGGVSASGSCAQPALYSAATTPSSVRSTRTTCKARAGVQEHENGGGLPPCKQHCSLPAALSAAQDRETGDVRVFISPGCITSATANSCASSPARGSAARVWKKMSAFRST